jgi:hypothetical protein
MKNLPITKLYIIRRKLIKEGMQGSSIMMDVCNAINEKESILLESEGAVGASSAGVSGMGAVVSSQPSTLAGTTMGSSWSDNGGTAGSGDIAFPYSAGTGGKTVFQKEPMGKNHGPRTGKKSRVKKIDMKALKDMFSKKQDFTQGQTQGKKVMNFNDYVKNDLTQIKK